MSLLGGLDDRKRRRTLRPLKDGTHRKSKVKEEGTPPRHMSLPPATLPGNMGSQRVLRINPSADNQPGFPPPRGWAVGGPVFFIMGALSTLKGQLLESSETSELLWSRIPPSLLHVHRQRSRWLQPCDTMHMYTRVHTDAHLRTPLTHT